MKGLATQRWVCVCAYDGSGFLGWQSQKGGGALQDYFEERLRLIFKENIRVHGSSRTDRGVHARGQVWHFDAAWAHSPEALFKALGGEKAGPVQVLDVRKFPNTFHARYSAIAKRYSYKLHLGVASPFEAPYTWSLCDKLELDVELMRQGAKVLIGRHDFSAFSALSRERNHKENPIKTLMRLDIEQVDKQIVFTTEASGYLYKMVRSLVGALVDVGRSKISLEALRTILQSKQRTHLVMTAPAHGLCLEKVFYEGYDLS